MVVTRLVRGWRRQKQKRTDVMARVDTRVDTGVSLQSHVATADSECTPGHLQWCAVLLVYSNFTQTNDCIVQYCAALYIALVYFGSYWLDDVTWSGLIHGLCESSLMLGRAK